MQSTPQQIGSTTSPASHIAAALSWSNQASKHLPHLPLSALETLISHFTPAQLVHLRLQPSNSRPLDFLVNLPTELSLHILAFVDDPKTLSRIGRVSKAWNQLTQDENIWKKLCIRKGFISYENHFQVDVSAYSNSSSTSQSFDTNFSFKSYFKSSRTIENNYVHSGHLIRTHRSQEAGIVSSLAVDSSWIAVGLANGRVHVFSAQTGILARTLSGHQAGAWCVWIVERGRVGMPAETIDEAQESAMAPIVPDSLSSSLSSSDMPFQSVFDNLYPYTSKDAQDDLLDFDSPNSPSHKLSLPSNSSDGWGQPNSLVVSAACDKTLRVWDVTTGYCLHVLKGHRSTVRCLKMFHGRPIAISGGRDATVRIWDIRKGRLLGTLEGHTESVRCLDVYGDMIVSGSYDCSVRLWSARTRQCLRVYNGHYHQVYTVAFDGSRIVSGGLDTSVRVWSVDSNDCVALLQGHTALVCQLQLSPSANTIISGSADGRIIIFGIPPHSSFCRRDTGTLSTPRPASLALPSPTILHGSPPSSPLPSHSSLLFHSPLRRPGGEEPFNDTFRIISSITAHTSSMTGLYMDENVPEPTYDGHEWVKHQKYGRRKWLISAGTDGRVLLWNIGNDSEDRSLSTDNHRNSIGKLVQVRALTESSDGVWKTAIRGDILVICCSRGGRTVLEIWSFRDEEML